MDEQEPDDILGLINFIKENMATKEDLADAECRLRARLDILYSMLYRRRRRSGGSTSLPPIVPVNDETRAMLEYASSPEGRGKIEKGRQEIRDGKGIVVSAGYLKKRLRIGHIRKARTAE